MGGVVIDFLQCCFHQYTSVLISFVSVLAVMFQDYENGRNCHISFSIEEKNSIYLC